MSSPNDPAYPCDVPRIGEEQGEFFTGMTIRQRFVMAAMQAQIAFNSGHSAPIAEQAIKYADATLAEEARTRK